MERLGLGFEAVQGPQPDIVYVSVSGLGQTRPDARGADGRCRRRRPSPGLMSVMRSREGAPGQDGRDADRCHHRPLCLPGRHHGALGHASPAAAPAISTSRCCRRPPTSRRRTSSNGLRRQSRRACSIRRPATTAPRTAGSRITLVNEAQFRASAARIGRPRLASDPRFSTFAARKANSRRCVRSSTRRCRAPDRGMGRGLRAEGGLASAIATYGDWLADPHVAAIDAAPAYALGDGDSARLPHLPGQRANTAAVPAIGEQSREVLARLGPAADRDRRADRRRESSRTPPCRLRGATSMSTRTAAAARSLRAPALFRGLQARRDLLHPLAHRDRGAFPGLPGGLRRQSPDPLRPRATARPTATRICWPTASRSRSRRRPGAGIFPVPGRGEPLGFIEQSSRFLKPVYAGDTLYPMLEVAELETAAHDRRADPRSTIHNQRDELVMDGLLRFLLKQRSLRLTRDRLTEKPAPSPGRRAPTPYRSACRTRP